MDHEGSAMRRKLLGWPIFSRLLRQYVDSKSSAEKTAATVTAQKLIEQLPVLTGVALSAAVALAATGTRDLMTALTASRNGLEYSFVLLEFFLRIFFGILVSWLFLRVLVNVRLKSDWYLAGMLIALTAVLAFFASFAGVPLLSRTPSEAGEAVKAGGVSLLFLVFFFGSLSIVGFADWLLEPRSPSETREVAGNTAFSFWLSVSVALFWYSSAALQLLSQYQMAYAYGNLALNLFAFVCAICLSHFHPKLLRSSREVKGDDRLNATQHGV